jgi:hypothetical protein
MVIGASVAKTEVGIIPKSMESERMRERTLRNGFF